MAEKAKREEELRLQREAELLAVQKAEKNRKEEERRRLKELEEQHKQQRQKEEKDRLEKQRHESNKESDQVKQSSISNPSAAASKKAAASSKDKGSHKPQTNRQGTSKHSAGNKQPVLLNPLPHKPVDNIAAKPSPEMPSENLHIRQHPRHTSTYDQSNYGSQPSKFVEESNSAIYADRHPPSSKIAQHHHAAVEKSQAASSDATLLAPSVLQFFQSMSGSHTPPFTSSAAEKPILSYTASNVKQRQESFGMTASSISQISSPIMINSSSQAFSVNNDGLSIMAMSNSLQTSPSVNRNVPETAGLFGDIWTSKPQSNVSGSLRSAGMGNESIMSGFSTSFEHTGGTLGLKEGLDSHSRRVNPIQRPSSSAIASHNIDQWFNTTSAQQAPLMAGQISTQGSKQWSGATTSVTGSLSSSPRATLGATSSHLVNSTPFTGFGMTTKTCFPNVPQESSILDPFENSMKSGHSLKAPITDFSLDGEMRQVAQRLDSLWETPATTNAESVLPPGLLNSIFGSSATTSPHLGNPTSNSGAQPLGSMDPLGGTYNALVGPNLWGPSNVSLTSNSRTDQQAQHKWPPRPI